MILKELNWQKKDQRNLFILKKQFSFCEFIGEKRSIVNCKNKPTNRVFTKITASKSN